MSRRLPISYARRRSEQVASVFTRDKASPSVIYETLVVDTAGGIGRIRLNRPDALNAISVRMRQDLSRAVDAFLNDPSVRVLILTGTGRAFSAGVDLKELSELGTGLSDGLETPVEALARFKGPIIAAINGLAVTGGMELALAGDVVLAAESARFADTHAKVGVLPRWGISQRLSRLIGLQRAKEMSLTGRFVTANEAAGWGLVTRVVPDDELDRAATATAEAMLAARPGMLVAYKSLIDDGSRLALGDALALEDQRARDHNAAVRTAALAESRTAVLASGRDQNVKTR